MPLLQLLFGFHGRIRRIQFWLAFFGVVGVWVLLSLPISFLPPRSDTIDLENPRPALPDLVFLLAILALWVLSTWVGLALQVKRWHDRDKSGWWCLVGLIPFGGLWMLIECGFLDGTQGPNKYGLSPKGIPGADLARTFE